MIIDKLFALMAEKKASDIFITVGTPIHIKIDGNTLPINQQAMDPTMIHRMAYEMMTPEQVERFERTREMNLSFGRRDMGNFRVNIFWQRNSIAIVVPLHRRRHPQARDTSACRRCSARSSWRSAGLVLVVGATGSGKSTTIASMLDHRNEQPLRPHPHHRRPDRISVQAQDVDREPARDRLRHRRLAQGPHATPCARRPTAS